MIMKFKSIFPFLLFFVSVVFVACDNDDDFHADKLAGTWEVVPAKDVAADGVKYFTFSPTSDVEGKCEVLYSDFLVGKDTTYYYGYIRSSDGKHINIFTGKSQIPVEEGDRTEGYDVETLNSHKMVWKAQADGTKITFRRISSGIYTTSH